MRQSFNFRLVPSTVLPNGSALVTNEGKEIPITEYMVQRACQRLEDHTIQIGAMLHNPAFHAKPVHLRLI